MTEEWSIAELKRFVEGSAVFFLRADGSVMASPLKAATAAREMDQPSRTRVDTLETTYGPDRSSVIHAWTAAHENPGHVTETFARVKTDEVWYNTRLRFVNLLHLKGIEAFVVASDRQQRLADFGEAPEAPLEQFVPAPWVILFLDTFGTITTADGMVEQIFGQSAEDIIGHNALGFAHPDDMADAATMAYRAREQAGTAQTLVIRFRRADGTYVRVDATMIDQKVNMHGNLLLLHDITERQAHEVALRSLAEEFQQLAEEVPSGVFRADLSGRIEFGNELWYELIAGGNPVMSVRDAAAPAYQARLDKMLADVLSASGPERSSAEFRSADEARTLLLTCRAVGPPGTPRRKLVGVLQDITGTVELRRRAEYDLLTGTLNRHTLDRTIEAALSSGTDVALIFVDIDDFKAVNDLYGHDAGDAVLVAVVERLTSAVRPSDEIGRYGGDEFVIVCHDVSAGAEKLILDRIASLLEEPINLDEHRSWIPRASVGVGRPQAGDRPGDVMQRADQSMYEMKRSRHATANRDATAVDDDGPS
jgi:diguanylate cyclase (GGDEF)-like protein/PAS domain S-box-containing protein